MIRYGRLTLNSLPATAGGLQAVISMAVELLRSADSSLKSNLCDTVRSNERDESGGRTPRPRDNLDEKGKDFPVPDEGKRHETSNVMRIFALVFER